MKIVVDINHPAHVHYFKNFIWEMEKRGHRILITATEKEMSFTLLNNYGFDFINLGSYGDSLIKKLMNIPVIDWKMYKAVKSFKPDIFVGFGSIRAAHVSFLLRKRCINFEDTEHSMEQIRLYLPFVNAICTPSCFKKDLGNKQVRFDGYMELAHLHPNYFTPNPAVLDDAGLGEDAAFIILRFVSWDASHDIGQRGMKNKIELVRELEKYALVFITSEGQLPTDLERYRINVPPEKLHDLLFYASLYVGEGATTASECAVLGTHAIFVNTLGLGYTDEEEEKYQLVYNFADKETMENEAFDKALELLENNDLREEGKNKRERLLEDKIDVTAFMCEFVEHYPVSFEKIKESQIFKE